METLQTFFYKLIDIVFWQTLLNHFRWVDWVTVAFVLMGLIYGMRKGLMRELVELVELIFIVGVTFTFHPFVLATLSTYLPGMSQKTLNPATFIVTALCTWFLLSVVDRYLQRFIQAKIGGTVKKVGGGVLGIVQFLLIWSLVSQAILMMPLRAAHKLYELGSSTTGLFIKTLAPDVYQAVLKPQEFFSKTKKAAQ